MLLIASASLVRQQLLSFIIGFVGYLAAYVRVLSLPLSHTLSLSISLHLSHTLSISISLSLSLSISLHLSHTLSLSLSLSLSFTLSLSLILSHSFSLSLSLSPTLSLPLLRLLPHMTQESLYSGSARMLSMTHTSGELDISSGIRIEPHVPTNCLSVPANFGGVPTKFPGVPTNILGCAH